MPVSDVLVSTVVLVVILAVASVTWVTFWLVRQNKNLRPPVVLDLHADAKAARPVPRSTAAQSSTWLRDVTPEQAELARRARGAGFAAVGGRPRALGSAAAAPHVVRDPAKVAEARRRALEELEAQERARAEEPTDPGFPIEKSLNAFFNYNGHTFDAYEALGLPRGVSLAVAREAFRAAILTCDPESRPFLEEAIRTIERRA